MNLSVAALEVLVSKGLSAADILDVARALDVRSDPTAAERMRRHRAKKADIVTVTRNVTPVTADAPPNDIYSNPPEPSSANADALPFSNRVVSDWNEAAKAGLTPAKGLDTTRKAHLRARVKDHGEAAVLEGIRNLAASPFHCGKNDRVWRANIGWFLKPENFLKALEMGRSADAAPVAPIADPAAYRASLADKPWMRGREGELAQPPPRNPTHGRGPAELGDLVSRITDHAA